MPPPRIIQIDGAQFTTLDGFYDEISRVLLAGRDWARNLDAFNDILCGDFSDSPRPITFVWKNAALSRRHLGYPETVRQLELRLTRSHPANHPAILAQLTAAKNQTGPTVFDWLMDILRSHAPTTAQPGVGVTTVVE